MSSYWFYYQVPAYDSVIGSTPRGGYSFIASDHRRSYKDAVEEVQTSIGVDNQGVGTTQESKALMALDKVGRGTGRKTSRPTLYTDPSSAPNIDHIKSAVGGDLIQRLRVRSRTTKKGKGLQYS